MGHEYRMQRRNRTATPIATPPEGVDMPQVEKPLKTPFAAQAYFAPEEPKKPSDFSLVMQLAEQFERGEPFDIQGNSDDVWLAYHALRKAGWTEYKDNRDHLTEIGQFCLQFWRTT